MPSLGLRLPDSHWGYSLDDTLEVAQLAEGLDYHSLWYPEESERDVFMVLARLAAETDSIRLGPGITPVFARVPTQIAMAAATLDEFSDGRAILGLGASSNITVEEWYGVAFDRPLRRIRETIDIVRRSYANERVNYDGELFTISEYPRSFEPVQDQLPIFNAAMGEQNRKLTGEYADGWLPVVTPFEKLSEYIDEVRDAAAGAGRDPAAVTIAPYIISCVSEDRTEARRHASEFLAFYVGGMDYYSHIFREFGFAEEVAAIRTAWQSDGPSAAGEKVTAVLLDSVAIAGTPGEARERLREYRDVGVDLPIVYPPKAPPDMIDRTIVELAGT